jgi:hypothetical protein
MRFLCVLSLLCGAPITSHALDREAFTFTKYDLDVRVEPELQRLGVRGRITLRNDSSEPQKHAFLQISSTLDWRSIQIGGKPVQFVSQPYTSDIDHTGSLSEAIVSLPQEVVPKGTVELEIGYEGTIPLDVTRLTRIGVPEEQAKHSDWDQIDRSFTAVRGLGEVVWYPVALEAASLSEKNLLFATLERWKAREAESEMEMKFVHFGGDALSSLICNGKAITEGYEQISRAVTVTTECDYRPRGMKEPIFIIGNYQRLDQPPVSILYLPADKSAAENYALAAQLAAPFVNEWFGNRAGPGGRAQVVDLSYAEAVPYESGVMLLRPLRTDDSRLYELTVVHQLAHAAFASARLWIYEGLAHFAQAEFQERQNGRQSAIDFMTAHGAALVDAERVLAPEHNSDGSAQESLINTSREEFYRSKAMYVWWMLRDMIGEGKLKKALAEYHSDQDQEPSYMQHLIEAQSKRDLEWFFDDWVYRDRGLPDFRVESAYPRPTVGGGYVLTVTIDNSGEAGAEVPVTLRMEDGEVTKRIEVRGKSKSSIRMEAASSPREVVVNDGSVPESNLANNRFTIHKP